MTAEIHRIGRYSVIRRLGAGGIGEVFLATKEGSLEQVALKRIRPEIESNENALLRLEREAHVLTLIDHPNVARVLDAGREGTSFCIATEYVHGVNLDAVILTEAKPLPLRMVIAIGLAVLDALITVHSAVDHDRLPLGVVHRDLSPKNLMLSYAGDVKIIDFGIARARVDDLRTQTGMVIGTPTHLSPEQAMGRHVDARSDLYSFAVVLWECLTGRRMVTGTKVLDIVRAVLEVLPSAPSLVAPHVPRAVDEVILRGLAKSPDERWPDARSFRDALASAADVAPASAHEIAAFLKEQFPSTADLILSPSDGGPPTSDESPLASSDLATVPEPRKRSTSLAPAAASVVAIALGVLAIVSFDREPKPAPMEMAPVDEAPAPKPRVAPRLAEPRERPEPPRPAKHVEPRRSVPPKPTDDPPLAPREDFHMTVWSGDRALQILDGLEPETTAAKNAVTLARTCIELTCTTTEEKIAALRRAVEAARR